MKRAKLPILLTLVVLLFATHTAFAGPLTLRLSNGSDVVEVDGSSNFVWFVGQVGNYQINLTTGSQGIGFDYMELSSINASVYGATAAPLVIELSATDLTTPISSFMMTLAGFLSPTIATGIYEAFYDTTNSLYGTGGTIGAISFAGGSFATSQTGSGPGSVTPYSLTQRITITPNGATSLVFAGNATLNPATTPLSTTVPEPSELLLLGVGLIGLGVGWRSRWFASIRPSRGA